MLFFYKTTTYLLRSYFRIFHRLRVYGIQNPYPGGAILAPNHASFFDPPLIGATWPEEIHFLARASLFRPLPFRWLLGQLNAHPIQGTAQTLESFRIICQLLSEGKKVVIFPEGMRSESGQLQTIKSGVAMLALRAQCPVIPVYIQGTYEAWPKSRRWPKVGIPLTCVFGKPILPSSFNNTHKKEAQEALTKQVQMHLENLRHWLNTGTQGDPP